MTNVTLKPSTVKAFGGGLQVQAQLAQSNNLTLNSNAQKLDLRALTAMALPKSKFGLSGNLEKLTVAIAADKRRFKQTLAGNIEGYALDGELTGVNLLRETLAKADKIPGLGATMFSDIPEKYRPLLQCEATTFDSWVLSTILKNES